MTLKSKLYILCLLLHLFLFVLVLTAFDHLGLWLLAVEATLIISLIIFVVLIRKALQPLAYIDIFSNMLKQGEFNSRFTHLKQLDLDQLIDQFNSMLEKLHNERLSIGEQTGIFQKLMQESPIGVILLDYDNSVSNINPAAEVILSADKREIIGKNFIQLNHHALNPISSLKIDSQQLITLEQGQRLKVGHYHIRDRGFSRSFYLLHEMTSDIAQTQKVAYEKLIRLMSHEVNNTIAITNSLLQSSLNFKSQLDQASQQDFSHAINIVIKRCASLNQFMQSYADVIKLTKPFKSKFNLSKLLKDLSDLCYAECKRHQIKIRLELIDNLYINADANLIEQCLLNIIKNSIEAIEQDGEIIIKLEQVNGQSLLSISDNGYGISPADETELFTPFFTSKEQGQGVGLMLVREILNLHHYQFSLRNNLDKPGALFKIQISDQ